MSFEDAITGNAHHFFSISYPSHPSGLVGEVRTSAEPAVKHVTYNGTRRLFQEGAWPGNAPLGGSYGDRQE